MTDAETPAIIPNDVPEAFARPSWIEALYNQSNYLADRQNHYSAQCLTRNPNYDGPASHMTEDEARRCLKEMLRYFAAYATPPPPRGLPGALQVPVSEIVMDALHIGESYQSALVWQEPRRQINLYRQMRDLLRKAYDTGREDELNEICAREGERRTACPPSAVNSGAESASDMGTPRPPA